MSGRPSRGAVACRLADAVPGRQLVPLLAILAGFALYPAALLWRSQRPATWELVRGLGTMAAVDHLATCRMGSTARIFVAVRRHGLYYSSDQGRSWQGLTRSCLWGQATVSALAVSPASDDVLLLALRLPDAAPAFYKSADAGGTWGLCRALGQSMVEAVAFGPGGEAYAVAGRHLYRSDDAGDTWLEIGDCPFETSITALSVIPRSGWLYLASEREGVWSADKDGRWLRNRVPDSYVNAVTFTADGVAYASTAKGLYRSEADSRSWQAITLPEPEGVAALAAAGESVAVILADGSLFLTMGTGLPWQPLPALPENVEPMALAFAPSRDLLLVATQRGLWRLALAPMLRDAPTWP